MLIIADCAQLIWNNQNLVPTASDMISKQFRVLQNYQYQEVFVINQFVIPFLSHIDKESISKWSFWLILDKTNPFLKTFAW